MTDRFLRGHLQIRADARVSTATPGKRLEEDVSVSCPIIASSSVVFPVVKEPRGTFGGTSEVGGWVYYGMCAYLVLLQTGQGPGPGKT